MRTAHKTHTMCTQNPKSKQIPNDPMILKGLRFATETVHLEVRSQPPLLVSSVVDSWSCDH